MPPLIDALVNQVMSLLIDVEYCKRMLRKALDSGEGRIEPLNDEQMQEFKAETLALLKETHEKLGLPGFEGSGTGEEATRDEQ